MSPTTTVYPTYYGPQCPQGPPPAQAQGGYPSVATTCTQGPPCHPIGHTGYQGCPHPTTMANMNTTATVCTQLGAGCPPAVTQHCGVTQVPGQQTAYCGGTGPVAPAAPMLGMHTAATVCTQLGAGCPPPHTWTTTVGQPPQHQNTAATLCTQVPACPPPGPAAAYMGLPPTTNFCITMHCPPPAPAVADTVGPPIHFSYPPYCPGSNTGAVPPAGSGVYNPPATAFPHCLPGGQTGVRIPSIPPDCPAGQASPEAAQPLLSAPPHCPTVQACYTHPMQCITTAAAAPVANVSVPPNCPTVSPQCYGPTQWPHCYSPAGQIPAAQPLLSAPPHCPTVQACHTQPPQCPHLLSAPPHCPEAPAPANAQANAPAQGGFSVPPNCPTVPPQCYGPTQWPHCPPPAGAQVAGNPAAGGQPLASAATHCPTVPPMCQPTWNCQLPPASVPPMCPVTVPA